eukprot:3205268-Rhodomonas_salina.1
MGSVTQHLPFLDTGACRCQDDWVSLGIYSRERAFSALHLCCASTDAFEQNVGLHCELDFCWTVLDVKWTAQVYTCTWIFRVDGSSVDLDVNMARAVIAVMKGSDWQPW